MKSLLFNKKKMVKNKKGLSPVVATVLLISLVIVLGAIIFLWFRGIVEEPIEKDIGGGGQNVKMVCGNVQFDAEYSGEVLQITNTGNVPIFDMRLVIDKIGAQETKNLKEVSESWEESGLNSGASFSSSVEVSDDATQVTIVPILLGETSEGRKTHVCDTSEGYKLTI